MEAKQQKSYKLPILAVLLVAILGGGAVGWAVLTSYGAATATATVEQSIVSADNGATLSAVEDTTDSATIYGGETGRVDFKVTNRNRVKSIYWALEGTITVPTGQTGANIVSVNLDGVACTYDAETLEYACPATSTPATTVDEVNGLKFVLADHATPSADYGASINILPASAP